MNEGLQINGITLGGNWDTESTLQKELHIGFEGWSAVYDLLNYNY